jgi:hypothetical protein
MLCIKRLFQNVGGRLAEDFPYPFCYGIIIMFDVSMLFPGELLRIMEPNYKEIIQLDAELNQIQDLDILLERILREARKVVRADAGSIYVCEKVREKEDKEPVEKLVIKYSQNDTLQKELPPGQKLIYSVFSVPINEKTLSGYCGLIKKIVNVPNA